MALVFRKLERAANFRGQSRNVAYLKTDNWDDYGFKTIFFLTVFDENGVENEIGTVKIAYVGLAEGWTAHQIPDQFNILHENYFSLGQDADYYQNIVSKLSPDMANNLLTALGDVVNDSNRLSVAEQQPAFGTSLLRSVSKSAITNQFIRILGGGAPLTEYDFFYEKVANERYSGIKVEFKVNPDTKPSSNIHILIGRNGIGKTTLLNNMVNALLPNRGEPAGTGAFATRNAFFPPYFSPLDDDYFGSVVSVSFSAFDPFIPPPDQPDANLGTCYYYVGLKQVNEQGAEAEEKLKTRLDLRDEFIASIKVCLSLSGKKERWINSVRKLESDDNFELMNLCQLVEIANQDQTPNKDQLAHAAGSLFILMSSGHAIVLLSVTKLVETVEEKTLVLIDEPESHLHPPLLSAFTRALSDLLINRNGVAIIATHSPVVLQEVPKSCVSILRRRRLVGNVDRPENETFAENVGALTREVFGLEVAKSGFLDLLSKSVAEGKSYDEIEREYNYQIGFEGKAILRSLIATRDAQEADY